MMSAQPPTGTAEDASVKLFAQIKSIVQGMYPAILDDLDDVFLERLKTFYEGREKIFQKNFDEAVASLKKEVDIAITKIGKSETATVDEILKKVDEFATKLGAPANFTKALQVATDIEKPISDLWEMIHKGNLSPKQVVYLIVGIVSLAVTIFGLLTGRIPALP